MVDGKPLTFTALAGERIVVVPRGLVPAHHAQLLLGPRPAAGAQPGPPVLGQGSDPAPLLRGSVLGGLRGRRAERAEVALGAVGAVLVRREAGVGGGEGGGGRGGGGEEAKDRVVQAG